jgi:phosphonate transport system substrate-binding protein
MKKILLILAAALIWVTATAAADKPLVIVWYPNNSSDDVKSARVVLDDLIAKATGRQVVDKLTTDYVIAIEAIATGNAAICYPGAVGYVQASMKNPHVVPLVTNSSPKGTLDDSVYYSRLAVRTEEAPKYLANGTYSIDNIKGKVMSYVSSSSTSGFMVPSTMIKSYFAKKMGWTDEQKVEDLFLQGGSDQFFSQVIFGQSHQGSIYNVLSGKADVCAVDDVDVDRYFDLKSGSASMPGAVYVTRADAAAPFDTVPGTSFTVIAGYTVKQAPIVVNTEIITPALFKKLQDAFTSDATTNNQRIFVPEGLKDANGQLVKGFFTKTDKERFLPVDAKWYNSIRAMME